MGVSARMRVWVGGIVVVRTQVGDRVRRRTARPPPATPTCTQVINNIASDCLRDLEKLKRPFKYVVTCIIMQKVRARPHPTGPTVTAAPPFRPLPFSPLPSYHPGTAAALRWWHPIGLFPRSEERRSREQSYGTT